MVTGGRNQGRVGVITHRERHDGGFNIVHIKDAVDNEFATRESNVFVIGREKPWISLPKGKGVKVCFPIFTVGSHVLIGNSCLLLRSVIVAGRSLVVVTSKSSFRGSMVITLRQADEVRQVCKKLRACCSQ